MRRGIDLLLSFAPARISDNIYGELYSKLIVNACINSLGAIAGVSLGRLLALKAARDLFIEIMTEAVAVARAMGVAVPPGGGGKLDCERFLSGGGVLSEWRRHLTIRLIGFKYRRIRSSSLQSLERGRPTEVEFLNGHLCIKGEQHGVATPVNKAVVSMIHEIEEGRRSIAVGNLSDPVFARRQSIGITAGAPFPAEGKKKQNRRPGCPAGGFRPAGSAAIR